MLKNLSRKNILALVAVLAAFGSASALASPRVLDEPKERELDVGINDAFVPGGFDSDSDANVIVNGIFPNGCYRWSRAEVNKLDEKVTEVKTKAKVRSGMCLMVLIPFTNEINLGKLPAGENTIRFVSGDGTYLEKKVNVE